MIASISCSMAATLSSLSETPGIRRVGDRDCFSPSCAATSAFAMWSCWYMSSDSSIASTRSLLTSVLARGLWASSIRWVCLNSERTSSASLTANSVLFCSASTCFSRTSIWASSTFLPGPAPTSSSPSSLSNTLWLKNPFFPIRRMIMSRLERCCCRPASSPPLLPESSSASVMYSTPCESNRTVSPHRLGIDATYCSISSCALLKRAVL
mmetsp:Transcript_125931/g.218246  ORF Transcript_125931/g.218246 Transcript_125931/m.218246 type:complete len:210 (-) Transcript_125931:949-1578(-)